MIALSGDRTLLLKVFARRVSPCDDGIVVSSIADFPSAEIVVLFPETAHRGELPHSIVVAKSNLREFFAWAATYLGHWSPLTARVKSSVALTFRTFILWSRLSVEYRRK